MIEKYNVPWIIVLSSHTIEQFTFSSSIRVWSVQWTEATFVRLETEKSIFLLRYSRLDSRRDLDSFTMDFSVMSRYATDRTRERDTFI